MLLHRHRWTFALLALPAFAGVACGTSTDPIDRYPASVTAGFMNSCTAGGASQARCRCALDSIESTFTLEQFAALGEVSPSAHGFPGLDALLASCSE